MSTFYRWLSLWSLLLCAQMGYAQGPPITTDNPIMLGSKSMVIKTLTEIRETEEGTFIKAPFMFHYLPSSNTLVAIHLPYVGYDFDEGRSEHTLGDIELLFKYQFLRKDRMAKTFRMVAKTLQTFPTGPSIGIDGISTGNYQSYKGIVAGYESIKYGITNEIGYNFSPSDNLDELRYKLGIGLPLLKPSYPVNQLNLYFEYQMGWFTEPNDLILLYAQGIQYAKGRVTVEAAIQLPLVQTIPSTKKRKYSLFLGTRYFI